MSEVEDDSPQSFGMERMTEKLSVKDQLRVDYVVSPEKKLAIARKALDDIANHTAINSDNYIKRIDIIAIEALYDLDN